MYNNVDFQDVRNKIKPSPGNTTVLIVDDSTCERWLRECLSGKDSMRYEVTTYTMLIKKYWELFGDERILLSTLQKRAMLFESITKVSSQSGFVLTIRQVVDLAHAIEPLLIHLYHINYEILFEHSRNSISQLLIDVLTTYSKFVYKDTIDYLEAGETLSSDKHLPPIHLVKCRPLKSITKCFEQLFAINSVSEIFQDSFTTHMAHPLFTDVSKFRFLIGEGDHTDIPSAIAMIEWFRDCNQDDGIIVIPRLADMAAALIDACTMRDIIASAELEVTLNSIDICKDFVTLVTLLFTENDKFFAHGCTLCQSKGLNIKYNEKITIIRNWRRSPLLSQMDVIRELAAHVPWLDTVILKLPNLFDRQGIVKLSELVMILEQLMHAYRDEESQRAKSNIQILLENICYDSIVDVNVFIQMSHQECFSRVITNCSGDKRGSHFRFITPNNLLFNETVNLGVMRMDSDSFPTQQDPALQDVLLSRMGLPPDSSVSEKQQFFFNQMIAAHPKNLALHYQRRTSGGNLRNASALFENIRWAYQEEDGLANTYSGTSLISNSVIDEECPEEVLRSQSETMRHIRQKDTLPSITIPKTGYLSKVPEEIKNKEVFSVTELKALMECPYKWFISLCIPQEDKAQNTTLVQGTMIHEVMERFYKRLKEAERDFPEHRVVPSNVKKAEHLAAQVFDDVVNEYKERAQTEYTGETRDGEHARAPQSFFCPSTAQDDLTLMRMKRGITKQLSHEAHLLENSGGEATGGHVSTFIPQLFEVKVYEEKGFNCHYAGITVRGKVDRVDIDEYGNMVVIDYKSGAVTGYGAQNTSQDMIRGSVQVDIYATLLQRQRGQRCVGGFYRSLSASATPKTCLRGSWDSHAIRFEEEGCVQKSDAADEQSYQEYLMILENTVAAKVDAVRKGIILPDPRCPESCAFCEVSPFCPVFMTSLTQKSRSAESDTFHSEEPSEHLLISDEERRVR